MKMVMFILRLENISGEFCKAVVYRTKVVESNEDSQC